MKKPVLVVMAAGMGSRYKGLKQIDPVDPQGHILMDFSIFDAVRAGFQKVVLIVKEENKQAVKEAIGDRLAPFIQVAYAVQDRAALPEGFTVPSGRVKPWGTAHAVLCAAEEIDGPFAVINADDFYGRHGIQAIYDFLAAQPEGESHYAMVGYRLKNTVTDHGSVARGICRLNSRGELVSVQERTRIEKQADGIAYSEDGGTTWTQIDPEAFVSMNLWGFTPDFLEELKRRFPAFLEKGLREDPLKCEYFLPAVVNSLLEEGRGRVSVLHSEDRWYGVTYREDKPKVVEAIRRLKEEGSYPETLWEEWEEKE